jgi:hypothetical protein
MPAAERIRVGALSAAVGEAVRLAGERQRLTEDLLRGPFGAEAVRPPRWIFGRFVRADLAVAHKFAAEVTETTAASLKEQGLDGAGLSPTVIAIGDDILAGFIERFGQIELPGMVR